MPCSSHPNTIISDGQGPTSYLLRFFQAAQKGLLPVMSSARFRVASMIYSHWNNRTGMCNPGGSMLARECELTPQGVNQAIVWLKSVGIIKEIIQKRGGRFFILESFNLCSQSPQDDPTGVGSYDEDDTTPVVSPTCTDVVDHTTGVSHDTTGVSHNSEVNSGASPNGEAASRHQPRLPQRRKITILPTSYASVPSRETRLPRSFQTTRPVRDDVAADVIFRSVHPSRTDWERIKEMSSYGLPGARSHYFRIGPAIASRMLQVLKNERLRLEDIERRPEYEISRRLKVMILRYVAHPEEVAFDLEEVPEEESWSQEVLARVRRVSADGEFLGYVDRRGTV